MLNNTLLSVEDLKAGQKYDAIITDVNYAYSQPVQVSVSPFIKGGISFDKLADAETLTKDGVSFLEKFKVGSTVQVYYNNSSSEFSIFKPSSS